MRQSLFAAAALLIFGFTIVHSEPEEAQEGEAAESAPAAPAMEPAEAAPAPAGAPARTPFRPGRGSAPAGARSSGAPAGGSPGSASAPPAHEPDPSPEPAPAPRAGNTPAPYTPPGPPSGKVGTSWTPEGSGIDKLDGEVQKYQTAVKAWADQCAKEHAAAVAKAHPRAHTAAPTPAQAAAGVAAMKAAGIKYMFEHCATIQSCGGTPADCVKTFGDACRGFQPNPAPAGIDAFEMGCYYATMHLHNTGRFWADAFCADLPLPIGVCFSAATYPGTMPITFDPDEVLRRASFGAHWNGIFTVQPTYEGRPDLDGHKMLKERLAYFDGLKDDFETMGVDPQLAYVLIMTHVLWAKCEQGDYFCTSFNNAPKLSSFRGMTLSKYLQQQKGASR